MGEALSETTMDWDVKAAEESADMEEGGPQHTSQEVSTELERIESQQVDEKNVQSRRADQDEESWQQKPTVVRRQKYMHALLSRVFEHYSLWHDVVYNETKIRAGVWKN